ncbi:hypothetical protein L3Y34_016004 [Caenorhabditis briggsae]|uniref:Uncharacterized protein n=1 Tax=Caenorhabditis briggsae TaxID=6238 RepID=A0AAE9J0I4_CAEBR|nr:hypothetical protein L3Y34_016004 [Caenorhabditis briggsae]
MMQVTIGHYGVMNRKTRMTEEAKKQLNQMEILRKRRKFLVYQILYVSSRQSERELVSQTMQSAIGHMLNYIRDYHLDIRTGSLESCKNRKTCENHLSWKDVKIFREKCRAENKNPDDFEPADLIGL